MSRCLLRALLPLLILAAAAATCRSEEDAPEAPKNVVLLIGDGMGVGQVTLARAILVGADGTVALDEFPVTGLAKTHSANYIVTDSAAAATALACGIKTTNQTIGMDRLGTAVTSILDLARASGRSVGVVTTTSVTHATPACFYAHVESRSKEKDIADQFAARADVDVALGGGARNFSEPALEQLGKAGYQIARTRGELLAARPGRLLGIFTPSHMSFDRERDAAVEPSLAEMTHKAIDLLRRNPQGFFLMVEGGKIDFAGHAHDPAAMAGEFAGFDAAIRVVIEFARERGDTLVVVTADHATGGLDIGETADLEKIRAFRLSGESMGKQIVEGKAIAEVVKENTGLELSASELAAVEASVAAEKGGERYAVQTTLSHVLSTRLGVTWMPLEYHFGVSKNTHGHDGGMVPVYADGPGAEEFGGTMDNTEIPRRIARVLGLDGFALGRPASR